MYELGKNGQNAGPQRRISQEKASFFESPWALMLLQLSSAVILPVLLLSAFGRHFPGMTSLALTMPVSATAGLLISIFWINHRLRKQRLRNVNRILTILEDR